MRNNPPVKNQKGFMTESKFSTKSGYLTRPGFMTKSGYLTRSGFTLIEIVVAMAIASLILLALGSIFVLMSKSHRINTNQEELVQNARISLERISRDLRQTNKIVTSLPPNNSDPFNPPSTRIKFHDGHYTTKIRYITYYLLGTNLQRQVSHYAFSSSPTSWVTYDSKDSFDSPPVETIDEDLVKADKIDSLLFYGNNVVNIDISATDGNSSFKFETQVLGRNL